MSSSVFSDLRAHVHTCTQICSYNTHTQVWMEPFGDIIFYTWLCSPKKAGRSPRVLKVREQHASEIRERERLAWKAKGHSPCPYSTAARRATFGKPLSLSEFRSCQRGQSPQKQCRSRLTLPAKTSEYR